MTSTTDLWLQNAASPVSKDLLTFHDLAVTVMILIITMVAYAFICRLWYSKQTCRLQYTDHEDLETVWTILPMLVLVSLAYPSLTILYSMGEPDQSLLSVKCEGHQWYWAYEMGDLQYQDLTEMPSTDSLSELGGGEYSNLVYQGFEADSPLVLPVGHNLKMLFSSTDVLHSWGVPALGIKMDCVPGRTNSFPLIIQTPGVYHGNCFEICGALHTFMPITVEAVPLNAWTKWAEWVSLNNTPSWLN